MSLIHLQSHFFSSDPYWTQIHPGALQLTSRLPSRHVYFWLSVGEIFSVFMSKVYSRLSAFMFLITIDTRKSSAHFSIDIITAIQFHFVTLILHDVKCSFYGNIIHHRISSHSDWDHFRFNGVIFSKRLYHHPIKPLHLIHCRSILESFNLNSIESKSVILWLQLQSLCQLFTFQ